MIPKTIHWCWFGHGEKSALVEKCVNSWLRHCPDFKIKEWNESNFDVTANRYVREAYENKKWAFVADYVRVYALYHEGGIYMDSDVEVVRSLDCFLPLTAFTGRDSVNGSLTGTMGSEKGGAWVKRLLDDYDDRQFVLPDGSLNLTTNVAYADEVMKPLGLTFEDREFEVPEFVKIFKQEVFCPKSFKDRTYRITDNTYTIHHFSATWISRRIHQIDWVNDHLGRVPAKIFSVLSDRPDRALWRVLRFPFRALKQRLPAKV